MPMTIECLEDGTEVNINKLYAPDEGIYDGTFQIQLNDGDWTDVSWENIGNNKDYDLINAVAGKSSMSKGDKLRFRNIDKWGKDGALISPKLQIQKSKSNVYGKLANSITKELASSKNISAKFANMFCDSTALIDVCCLDLRDITLASNCYESMFSGCTSLVNAPELPATALASRCYESMFSGCTSLVNAPELPATALASRCYESMFSGCTSLTSAPELLATALVGDCYAYMFSGCANIIELHFPASVESEIRAMYSGPTFGATNATAIFDL